MVTDRAFTVRRFATCPGGVLGWFIDNRDSARLRSELGVWARALVGAGKTSEAGAIAPPDGHERYEDPDRRARSACSWLRPASTLQGSKPHLAMGIFSGAEGTAPSTD